METLEENNAWKEIIDKLGIEVEAMRRYNSIRINFSKYLKCQKKEEYLELVKTTYT